MNAIVAECGWHTQVTDDHPAAKLLSARAVRERCAVVMTQVEAGASPRFVWRPERIDEAADFVVDVIRADYPDLAVPFHSRWRHFEAGGRDRWRMLAATAGLNADPLERARVAIDLVVPSVLLDAGAGADWRYREAGSGFVLGRSEGLAAASLALFASGALSAHARAPLRCDATALLRIDTATLATAFQAHGGNPLVGLAQRAALLRRLGAVIGATPAVFGRPARLGRLADYFLGHAEDGRIDADFVLGTLLRALGPVWPSRLSLRGVPLGDCWHHPALDDGLVPFHKLSQWLAYSLLEPLADAGLTVTGTEALTGLPEYRNGGLLLDFGVIEPRDVTFWHRRWTVDAVDIVEWRALTVIGLDRLAEAVRARLGVDATAFPLARVLQGGTWSAGRRIAARRRSGGAPPIALDSDGTVF